MTPCRAVVVMVTMVICVVAVMSEVVRGDRCDVGSRGVRCSPQAKLPFNWTAVHCLLCGMKVAELLCSRTGGWEVSFTLDGMGRRNGILLPI